MSFKKNTAVTGFAVGLTSSTDGSDITTGTPVGYYTLDGGTQTAIGDVTPVHEGNGLWTFDLTAAEMNGDIVGLTFTHASAITVHFTIKTDTKITSELNDIAATAIVSAGAITTSSGAVSTVSSVSGAVGSVTGAVETDAASRIASKADVSGLSTFNPATDAVATVTTLTNLPAITANWLTATGIAASALDGKGDWNIGKTGYTLTQSFPANFADFAITVTTGKVTAENVTLAAATHTGATIPTVTTLAGHTAQTGDSFARIGAAGANLTDLGGMSTGMKTQVNTEALDVIATDTYAEPGQETPAANSSLANKINYLYKAWRNKSEQTATAYSLYDDAGTTVDQKATVSDNGTTATKGEVGTGP